MQRTVLLAGTKPRIVLFKPDLLQGTLFISRSPPKPHIPRRFDYAQGGHLKACSLLGNRPWRTSSQYDLAAREMISARLA